MLNRIEILNELEGLSPFVASISPENMYEVPKGYFENFSDGVMSRIKAGEAVSAKTELEILPDLISNLDRKNLFSIPSNYFETFAENLMSKIKAEQSGSVNEELKKLSPFLSTLNKKTPFSIPENYFQELADNAMAGAKAVEFVNDELENFPPVLNDLKNKNVYETPDGYFENFSATVLQKIKKQQPAKIISINKKTNWLRYAAAAVVVGVIATSTVFIFNHNKSTFVARLDEKQLADSLHNANDEDILDYLQSHNISMNDASNNIASLDLSDNDADDMLADVSDSELQQYIDEYSGTKEETTN